MSEYRFTPGPWKVGKLDGGAPVVVAVGRRVARVLFEMGSEDSEVYANADLIAGTPITLAHLAAVLEWAKGNRGSKHSNPYGVPEVEAALRHMASLLGMKEWLDVDTAGIAKAVGGDDAGTA